MVIYLFKLKYNLAIVNNKRKNSLHKACLVELYIVDIL